MNSRILYLTAAGLFFVLSYRLFEIEKLGPATILLILSLLCLICWYSHRKTKTS